MDQEMDSAAKRQKPTNEQQALWIAALSRLGDGFDSHRPLQKSAKFTLIRLPLLTGHSWICAQKGFCAHFAPKFHSHVAEGFMAAQKPPCLRACNSLILGDRNSHVYTAQKQMLLGKSTDSRPAAISHNRTSGQRGESEYNDPSLAFCRGVYTGPLPDTNLNSRSRFGSHGPDFRRSMKRSSDARSSPLFRHRKIGLRHSQHLPAVDRVILCV
jgi:hypothetical protein